MTMLSLLLGQEFVPAISAEPLQGGIEHSERLPQVDRNLLPGSVFQSQEKEKEKPTGEWVRIPSWLAGSWQADKETAVLRKDMKTGRESGNTPYFFQAKIRFSYGTQKDTGGGIWHYVSTPYTSATDLPEFTEYHRVLSKRFREVSDDKVTIATRVIVARVGRQSRLVEQAFQQESITTYSPLSDGFIKLSASTETFDVQGSPLLLAKNEAKIKRVANFEPTDKAEGNDLKQMFREHLAKIGYGHLAPPM
ncbi:MAG TPA: hypothetical protein V6D17_14390 [Candidatus Obscuribacterales bacterium]